MPRVEYYEIFEMNYFNLNTFKNTDKYVQDVFNFK